MLGQGRGRQTASNAAESAKSADLTRAEESLVPVVLCMSGYAVVHQKDSAQQTRKSESTVHCVTVPLATHSLLKSEDSQKTVHCGDSLNSEDSTLWRL